MRKHEYIDVLKKVELFRGLDRHTLETIRGLTTELDRPAGTVWMGQGASGHEAFVVLSGEAKVEVDGRQIGTVGHGDVFGEAALLTRAPRTATVTATTPMRVLVLSRSEFLSLLHTAPSVHQSILDVVAEREAARSVALAA
jgi:CRP-like cAMP-binding protein